MLAAGLCAVFAAPAGAQVEPTEAELQSARERLQEGLSGAGVPPATYDDDPFPDFAVPPTAPYVLPHAAPLDPTASIAVPENSTAAAEASPQDEPPAAPQTAAEPAATEKPAPKSATTGKPAHLKTGRAAAAEPRKMQKAKPKPAAPRITLPGALRP